MERLTHYDNDGRVYSTRGYEIALSMLAAYEDSGLEPEDMKRAFNDDAVLKLAGQALGTTADRLRELAEADKDGRCVVLPCKVGDTVWTNFSIQGSYLRKTDRPYECRVLFVGLNESDSGGYINFEYVKSGYQFQMDFDQIGKTVFPTREAAEAVLKAGEPR